MLVSGGEETSFLEFHMMMIVGKGFGNGGVVTVERREVFEMEKEKMG